MNFANSLLFHARVCDTLQTTPQNNIQATHVSEDDVELTRKSNWPYNQIICLLNSMESHMDEANHPKKKKHLFDNIENDLLSNNFEVTAQQCQIKWKSLIRSYKICKDQKTKTGRGPSRFQFFEKMDELLGDKPSNTCAHSLESSHVSISYTSEDSSEVETEEGATVVLCSQVDERPKKKKKSEATNIAALITLRKEEYKKREERHKEKLAVEQKKIALLEKIVEKL